MVGMVRDAAFGPVIAFGAGGTAVEVLQDRAVALPPLNAHLSRRLTGHTRIAKLLGAFRNLPPANIDAIEACCNACRRWCASCRTSASSPSIRSRPTKTAPSRSTRAWWSSGRARETNVTRTWRSRPIPPTSRRAGNSPTARTSRCDRSARRTRAWKRTSCARSRPSRAISVSCRPCRNSRRR